MQQLEKQVNGFLNGSGIILTFLAPCAAQRRKNKCLMTTNGVSLRNQIQVNLPFREFFLVSN